MKTPYLGIRARRHLKGCQVILLLIVSLYSSLCLASQDAYNPPVKIVTEFLPPYQIVNHDGSLEGYSIELMEKILVEAGIESKITVYPWARSYKIASTQKNFIIFTMTRTPKRESSFHWIGRLNEERFLFINVKQDNELDIKSLDEIRNYSVIVSTESVGDQLLTNLGFPKIIRANSLEQMINMIQLRRADLVMASDYTYNNSIKPLNTEQPNKIAYVYKGKSVGLYIAASKTSDPQLISQLKSAYNTVTSTSIMEQLQVKWGLSDSE